MKQESSPPKEPSREELLAENQRTDEEIGQFSEWIPLHAAFDVAWTLAEQRGVPPYKTQKGLAHALRKAKLATTTIWRPVGTTAEAWSKSDDPEPRMEYDEVTSERAIKLLFERRSAQRRRLDLKRKKKKQNKKVAQEQSSKKLTRNPDAQKAEGFQSKAEPRSQKAESSQ